MRRMSTFPDVASLDGDHYVIALKGSSAGDNVKITKDNLKEQIVQESNPTIVTALSNGIPTVCSQVPVDSFSCVTWTISLSHSSGVRTMRDIMVVHDGLPSADATQTYFTESGLPVAFNGDINVSLDGVGIDQVMNLVITAPTTGWTATVTRTVAHTAGA